MTDFYNPHALSRDRLRVVASVLQLSPTFVVSDLAPVDAFYRRYFEAEVVVSNEWYRVFAIGKKPVHELAFMTARHDFQQCFRSGSANLNLRVDDVDAEFERLRALDAPLRDAPTDKPYGVRSFQLFDPSGLCLYIYRPIATDGVMR